MLECDIGAVVAGVSLVDEWLVDEVEQAGDGAKGGTVDAHRGVEAILIVGVEAEIEVVGELVAVGGQHVMGL